MSAEPISGGVLLRDFASSRNNSGKGRKKREVQDGAADEEKLTPVRGSAKTEEPALRPVHEGTVAPLCKAWRAGIIRS
jgi:hypothetical protein